MDTARIKSYAPKARRDFIEAVTRRAAKFGITEKERPGHRQGSEVRRRPGGHAVEGKMHASPSGMIILLSINSGTMFSSVASNVKYR